jgi:hypothetical protein
MPGLPMTPWAIDLLALKKLAISIMVALKASTNVAVANCSTRIESLCPTRTLASCRSSRAVREKMATAA